MGHGRHVSWRRLEARPVRGLEEERASRRRVAIEFQLVVRPSEQRAVPGVDDGAGRQLVRREKIGQHALARRVELRDGADEEPRAELIGVPQVDDVDAVGVEAGARLLNVTKLYDVLLLTLEFGCRPMRRLADRR